MTLGRQLASVISGIFFVALAGVQAIHLRGAQAHLQEGLESLAQDAATSLGLSLGALLKDNDPALAETVINPAFDRGHYERIEYYSSAGERLVSKRFAADAGDYPAWFAHLLPLEGPTAESLVTAGWRQLGKLRVTVHPRFAYEQLWQTARDTLIYMVAIYLVGLVALRLFLRSVLRPLAAVEGAALAISQRNFVRLSMRPAARELARVVEAMNTLSGKVNEAIAAETGRAEKLQAAAYRDEVMGLYNARGFAVRFESGYGGEHPPFAGLVALVELADLAGANRSLGPQRCNELLRALAGGLQQAALEAGGFAGRWSGAAMIVALPGLGGAAARERLAVLRARAGATLREFGLEGDERVRGGGAESPGVALPLASLAKTAEEALLRARELPEGVALLPAAAAAAAGGAPEEDDATTVREALAARRLAIVGQTCYRMSDHRALHVEIFARLRDGAGKELAAARFMPIVSAHGLGEALDKAVIEQAAAVARARDEAVSINLSMRSAERPEFVAWLAALLAREGKLAGRLAFEVTEHGAVRSEAAAAALAAMLRRAGAAFAIDNYGVHRDSLALMQRLKPDYVKLAGAHTRMLVTDESARFFAESLIRAARQLDIPVIAQNVEDDDTFQSLGALGFSGYQGNLGGPPAPWPGETAR